MQELAAAACGSQRRAAGVPQAIRNVLYFSTSPSCRLRAGGIAVRSDALRRVRKT